MCSLIFEFIIDGWYES